MIQETNRLRQILHIDNELNKIQDLDILLERILLEARTAVHADAGTIYISEGDQLEFRYTQNDTLEARLPPGQKLIYSVFRVNINRSTVSGYVADTGETLRIADMYAIPPDSPFGFNPSYDNVSGYRTVSSLTIPLRTNTGKILGVLQLLNKKNAEGKVVPFSKSDQEFSENLASKATIALQRAQMTRVLILRMVSMAELRDPTETAIHVKRVAAYTVALYDRWAERHQVAIHDLERTRDILRMASMVHDVGKVAIPDIIFLKPSSINEAEFEIMKTHTFLGARLFKENQSDIDEIAMQVALTHHENWDGTGYPGRLDERALEPSTPVSEVRFGTGLRGDEIPIFGRIVSVADVFDALNSKRVYKEAWEEQGIFEEMKTQSGRKFDPELVDIFFEIYPSFKQITARYPV